MLGDLEESVGQSEQRVPSRPSDEARDKPVRRPLPDHLPREEVVHAAACSCPSCGGDLRRLGEDVTEILEYRPGRFHVIRHLRPKFSCRRCEAITQAAMPDLPIERGRPGPGLLAHRSEEHPSELQSLMRISYAAFCLNKTKRQHTQITSQIQ